MPQVLSTVVGFFSSTSSSRFFQSLFLFLYTHATFSLSLHLSPSLSLLAAHGSYFYFIATVHHFACSEIPTDNKYDFIHSIKKTPRLVTFWHFWRRIGFLYNKAWKTDGFIIVRMTRMAFYFVYFQERKRYGLIHSIFLEIILECYWTTGRD
jgi:hypothetical protein